MIISIINHNAHDGEHVFFGRTAELDRINDILQHIFIKIANLNIIKRGAVFISSLPAGKC